MGAQLDPVHTISAHSKPLLAGLLYALLWVLGGLGMLRGRRYLESQEMPKPRHRVFQVDWRWWGQIALLLVSLGLLYLWLANGTLDMADVGLGRLELWGASNLLYVMGIVFGLICLIWIALLEPDTSLVRRPSLVGLGYTDLLAQGLTREAGLAILRGALIPLAGSYWGLWLAISVHAAISLPLARSLLAVPTQRRWLLLQLGLDWVGAAIFHFAASAWPGVALRLLSLVLLRFVIGLWLCIRLRRDIV